MGTAFPRLDGALGRPMKPGYLQQDRGLGRSEPVAESRSSAEGATRSTSVVIAEDNLLVRAGLEALLGLEDDVQVVGVCSDYDSLISEVDRCRPDVVITDIRMPPSSTTEGIQAACALRRSHPGVAVVVLSQFVAPSYVAALLAEGSQGRGYLLKERVATSGELVCAVRTVARGESYIDSVVVDALVSAQTSTRNSVLSRLTPRERETLAEVAKGKSNAAIASKFFVSERAIEKYVNSIFLKLDLSADPDANRRVKAVLLFLDEAS